MHGKRLFRFANAERVYQDNCPHFEQLVNQLLELQGMSSKKAKTVFSHPQQALFEEFQKLLEQEQDLYDLITAEIGDEKLFEIELELDKLEKQKVSLNEKIIQLSQTSE